MSLPFGALGATYGDHFMVIGKRVVDFLLVLTELFSLGVTAQAGIVDPKFLIERVAHTNHSSSPHNRLNGLSCGINIWTALSTVSS